MSLAISVAVAGGIAAMPCSRSARKTRLTMAGGASLVLRQTKAAHQASATWWSCSFSGDCSQARYAAAWRCTSRREPSGASAIGASCVARCSLDCEKMKRSLKSSSWFGSVVGVGPAKRRSPLSVVALDGLECLVGDASVDQRGGGPDQRVAALDVGVEEAEWLAWFQRLQPQRDLGQFDRHRVHVDAVDAVLHHVPQRGPQRLDGGFRVMLAHRGQALGDAPGGRDQEVPGTARWVADRDRQQGVGDGERRVGARVGRLHFGPFLRVV